MERMPDNWDDLIAWCLIRAIRFDNLALHYRRIWWLRWLAPWAERKAQWWRDKAASLDAD